MQDDTTAQAIRRLRRSSEIGVYVALGLAIVLSGWLFYQLSHAKPPAERRPTSRIATLLEEGDYDQALRLAKKVTEQSPNYYYGFLWLGDVQVAKGDLSGAEQSFEEALRLFPSEEVKRHLVALHERMAGMGTARR